LRCDELISFEGVCGGVKVKAPLLAVVFAVPAFPLRELIGHFDPDFGPVIDSFLITLLIRTTVYIMKAVEYCSIFVFLTHFVADVVLVCFNMPFSLPFVKSISELLLLLLFLLRG